MLKTKLPSLSVFPFNNPFCRHGRMTQQRSRAVASVRRIESWSDVSTPSAIVVRPRPLARPIVARTILPCRLAGAYTAPRLILPAEFAPETTVLGAAAIGRIDEHAMMLAPKFHPVYNRAWPENFSFAVRILPSSVNSIIACDLLKAATWPLKSCSSFCCDLWASPRPLLNLNQDIGRSSGSLRVSGLPNRPTSGTLGFLVMLQVEIAGGSQLRTQQSRLRITQPPCHH